MTREALAAKEITAEQIAAIGITNQRETTLVWDRDTGRPVHHAIVWQDTRTDAQLRRFDEAFGEKNFKERTGLPLAPYFAGSKLALAAGERRRAAGAGASAARFCSARWTAG